MNDEIHTESGNALKKTALISLALFFIKLLAFIPTGSLLVLTSLFDSLADTISSFLNHYVHKLSRAEADREHPFGHGGFEVIGSIVQGMVILFLGINLLLESLRRFSHAEELEHVHMQSFPLAFSILVFSALAGYGLQLYLHWHIRRLEGANGRSLALLADKAHYKGDALVNLLSAVGLLAVYWAKSPSLDALFGCAGGVFLLITGLPILKKCFNDIAHNEAPIALQQQIVDIVLAQDQNIKGIHHLRSRELGPHLFVDFHMKIKQDLSLIEAHELSEKVEAAIKSAIPRTDVMIHLDPDTEADQQAWQPSYKIPTGPS